MTPAWNHHVPGSFIHVYSKGLGDSSLANQMSSLVYSVPLANMTWNSPNGDIERALYNVPETL